MAATTEFNSALFMETVQRYECLYNKFSRDYKNKFTRMNCWRTIGGQFNLEPAEAERKYKNIRSAYCRFLKKKKKAVPSGSGRDAVPVPPEFSNLDWLVSHINHRAATVSNLTNSCNENVDEGLAEDPEPDESTLNESDNDCEEDSRRSEVGSPSIEGPATPASVSPSDLENDPPQSTKSLSTNPVGM